MVAATGDGKEEGSAAGAAVTGQRYQNLGPRGRLIGARMPFLLSRGPDCPILAGFGRRSRPNAKETTPGWECILHSWVPATHAPRTSAAVVPTAVLVPQCDRCGLPGSSSKSGPSSVKSSPTLIAASAAAFVFRPSTRGSTPFAVAARPRPLWSLPSGSRNMESPEWK